jgi:D-alanine-D-alanine ligase
MSKLQVAVLRGGPSRDYLASIQSGTSVLRHIPEKYQAHDIFISKDGIWHRNGAERTPDRALQHIDVAVNALHGDYGEDGKVQKLLGNFNIPYTGSDALSSAISMNKILSKNNFDSYNIKTPYHVAVKKDDDRQEISKYVFNHFLLPFVVKPASGSFEAGLSIVKSFNDLPQALEHAFSISDTALIEEYVRGREATCGVIDKFRGESLYTLLPVEIDRKTGRETIPGNFTPEEKQEIFRIARLTHQALNMRHYSHIDMILTPRRGIYVLEANSLPSLAEGSRFPQSLEAIGSNIGQFLDHLISTALNN